MSAVGISLVAPYVVAGAPGTIGIDNSTPPAVTTGASSVNSLTTAAFTPPANSLLVVFYGAYNGVGQAMGQPTTTIPGASFGAGPVANTGAANGARTEIWLGQVGSSGTGTVTVPSTGNYWGFGVAVVTGAAQLAQQNGVTNTASAASGAPTCTINSLSSAYSLIVASIVSRTASSPSVPVGQSDSFTGDTFDALSGASGNWWAQRLVAENLGAGASATINDSAPNGANVVAMAEIVRLVVPAAQVTVADTVTTTSAPRFGRLPASGDQTVTVADRAQIRIPGAIGIVDGGYGRRGGQLGVSAAQTGNFVLGDIPGTAGPITVSESVAISVPGATWAAAVADRATVREATSITVGGLRQVTAAEGITVVGVGSVVRLGGGRVLGSPTVTLVKINRPASLTRTRTLGTPSATLRKPSPLVRARALGLPTLSGRAIPAGLVHSRDLPSPATTTNLNAYTVTVVGIDRV